MGQTSGRFQSLVKSAKSTQLAKTLARATEHLRVVVHVLPGSSMLRCVVAQAAMFGNPQRSVTTQNSHFEPIYPFM